MKVYLSGPMTGIPQFNFPVFDDAAKVLRALGYEVINPAELDGEPVRSMSLACESGEASEVDTLCEKHGVKWPSRGEFLGRDIKVILDEADAVVVLPGWAYASGAVLETFAAYSSGTPIYEYEFIRPSYLGVDLGWYDLFAAFKGLRGVPA